MHNTHCCHATFALQGGEAVAYLHIVPKEQRSEPKDETSTEMNLIRNYRNWRRYRETVTELSRLTNRELQDLGISRGDIPFVARRAA